RQEAEGLLQKGLHLAEKARHAPLESAGALYPEAIILIRQAAARDPVKDPVASKTLGALFELLLEYAAVALRKESFEMSSFLLSEAELLGNDPERVDKLREEVDEARRVHEGYKRYLTQGRKRLAEGDFQGAIPAILQAMMISETQDAKDVLEQARYQKSMAEGEKHAQAGDWEEAHRAYRVALANASDGEREVVEAKCSRAREEVCSPLFAKASDAERDGKSSEAKEILNQVLQIDPGHRLARIMLADLERSAEAPPGAVYIPGGEFSLASDLTGRKEILGSFYIDRFEVTNRQFLEFVEAKGYETEDLWDSDGWEHLAKFISRPGVPGPMSWTGGSYPKALANHPVTGVSWYEARAYARWRGERLPAELEWEKSASGNTRERRKYPWGHDWDPSNANLGANAAKAVGGQGEDESPFGVRDLGGNVNEWTVGASGTSVVKGGSFLYAIERYARCSFRAEPGPLYRSVGTGFRCVREIVDERNP
ncbi:MAG: SUMF1/EgtB/PvdO family nonheme iron enzyme, partial [Planctomycetota bacterium]|nr:SUMF1/EgtB/PvdO family nonheme iron enzyme [Planctomycetota bacterium]